MTNETNLPNSRSLKGSWLVLSENVHEYMSEHGEATASWFENVLGLEDQVDYGDARFSLGYNEADELLIEYEIAAPSYKLCRNIKALLIEQIKGHFGHEPEELYELEGVKVGAQQE